jgi:predicted DNA-binding transcriptional regulator YafY
VRASRLLRLLLLLQNRGRMTTAALARELEVARRTVLRDVDALTEAGLPIIVHRGNRGGIELGFNYRTRLTGLAADEAEAIAVVLSKPMRELSALGLAEAGARARAKLFESFPDGVRTRVEQARSWFRFGPLAEEVEDPRIHALAEAIRGRRIVRLQARSNAPRVIHPAALMRTQNGWSVLDALSGAFHDLEDWGAINISAKTF